MIERLAKMTYLVRVLYLLLFWAICILGTGLIMVCSLFSILQGKPSAWNIIIATDRLLNTSLGGVSTETLSSRAYRGSLKGITRWCILCKLLDIIETDHCKKSEGI